MRKFSLYFVSILSVFVVFSSSAAGVTKLEKKEIKDVILKNPTCESYISDISLIDDTKVFIEDNYATCIDIINPQETTWVGLVSFEKLNKDDLEGLIEYLSLFRSEFKKYSPEFVKNTNLKRIAFVKNLSNLGAKVAALPDYYQEILYFDIYRGASNPEYQKHVIHHEYYHMIEEELNGSAYYKDPTWNSFNKKDFNYGTGGVSSICQVSGTGKLNHPLTGFLNNYSACGLEEDKAEVFATLLTDEEKNILAKFSEKDPILVKKINYMKEFVKKYGLNYALF